MGVQKGQGLPALFQGETQVIRPSLFACKQEIERAGRQIHFRQPERLLRGFHVVGDVIAIQRDALIGPVVQLDPVRTAVDLVLQAQLIAGDHLVDDQRVLVRAR